MNLILQPEPLPLRLDEEGTVRVGRTRVTLDSLVDSFCADLSPERTVEQYPTLELADVYSVFGFYLRHREEVERLYLAPRRAQAEAQRREDERRWPPEGIRERLMARRAVL